MTGRQSDNRTALSYVELSPAGNSQKYDSARSAPAFARKSARASSARNNPHQRSKHSPRRTRPGSSRSALQDENAQKSDFDDAEDSANHSTNPNAGWAIRNSKFRSMSLKNWTLDVGCWMFARQRAMGL